MKGKGKGTSTKVVPKEVTPAIQGLGENVPQPVREAYVKLLRADATKREEVLLPPLEVAVATNPSAASSLALAKAYIHIAMDVCGTKARLPMAQLDRDEKVASFLVKAAEVTSDAAVEYSSHLCLILSIRLVYILSDLPYSETEAKIVAVKLMKREPEYAKEKQFNEDLQSAAESMPLLNEGILEATPAKEIIPEDVWPFEELVCSNAGRLKLILDHAGGMLRATASNFINSDETFYTSSSVRFQYTLFKASSAPGLRQQRQRSLEALGKGEEQDGLKVQCEHFKLWLSKMKEDLVSRLAISPYAPKTEASRLAKTVSDNMQSKIKAFTTSELWIKAIKDNTAVLLQ